MEYIGLGSNCSITYQLNKHKLRTRSYPFDWTKISLSKLIDVLENNFTDYFETIEIKKVSSTHPYISDNNLITSTNSFIITNRYGVNFAHELISKYGIDEFKNKVSERINRFKNLLLITNKVKFVRIELCKIKSHWYHDVLKLLNLLDKFVSNYELILIINTNDNFKFPPNVKIYKFDDFSSDWKMDKLNWNDILYK
jgi:hypothetical protein